MYCNLPVTVHSLVLLSFESFHIVCYLHFLGINSFIPFGKQINLKHVEHFIQVVGSYEGAIFRRRTQVFQDALFCGHIPINDIENGYFFIAMTLFFFFFNSWRIPISLDICLLSFASWLFIRLWCKKAILCAGVWSKSYLFS